MADLRPFRGILYDPETVGSFESVVAPPYDVIDRAHQDRLYERSPYNAVRIDFARDEDRYGAAARTYREWLERGVLRRDSEPALYAYAQAFTLPSGEQRERWGFFASLHLEDFASGKVRPHEKTLPSAKADRLALQHACRANLSPIFGLYSIPKWNVRDALGITRTNEPLLDFTDEAGVRQRFWRVTDPASSAVLVDRLDGKTIYIADGHHRYETALRYRDEMREATGKTGGDEPFDYVLAFLCNMDEPGVVVLPTHRLFREIPLEASELESRLGERFRVERVARDAKTLFEAMRAPEGERRIGIALRDAPHALVLATRDGENDERLDGSEASRRLDVTLLHRLVLEGVLGLEAEHEAEAGRLVYVKDDFEAVSRVEKGEFAAAFCMNATRVDEMKAVCEAGETMPEKSTYFYPKVLTGLVFHSLEDE